VDINRARAKAAAPIVKTSNIGELNQMLAGSSPNPWAPPPRNAKSPGNAQLSAHYP
jgi:hypothetical protein